MFTLSVNMIWAQKQKQTLGKILAMEKNFKGKGRLQPCLNNLHYGIHYFIIVFIAVL